ncbi:putative prophage protein (ps3) [Dissulfuribacter thermophilus]|uniref:Putative prophage protein (Ps3) n=2 Tax=Dissulfuribacter thermophilus TaxID=1156395 RepID=A0A1B9F854_9BACT|nr:putative prophage protein (ps3) [Dissulfuribacter thermophilus]
MKLQKLVYYCQAWSLVWDDKPLYSAQIQAWANGPVVPALYKLHRGKYTISEWPEGDPNNLTPQEKETIDAVLDFYGDKSSQWLIDLTHMEDPWRNARKGLGPGERGNRPIRLADMAEYYSSLNN